MLRSFIQLIAIILTLGASFFLLKSNWGLTPETIAKVSSTYWDYSMPVAKGVAEQYADTRVGGILLLVAFVFQLINTLWPTRWNDFGVNWHGVIIAFGVSIVLLTFAHLYSKNLSEQMYIKTVKILQEKEKSQQDKPNS